MCVCDPYFATNTSLSASSRFRPRINRTQPGEESGNPQRGINLLPTLHTHRIPVIPSPPPKPEEHHHPRFRQDRTNVLVSARATLLTLATNLSFGPSSGFFLY